MVGISVIMPVYNVSNYLQNAIESIQKQSFEDIELICVNDGSTDNSLEVLNNIRKEYDFLKIINQENAGPGIARNTGIENASGEYIAFLDSDDIFLDEEALEKMYSVAKENDADIVCGNLKWINQDYTIDKYYDFVNTKYSYAFKEETITTQEYGTPFAFYKNIFKKDFLKTHNIHFPNMRAGEDPIFMVNALTNTENCYMVPVDLYGYNHSIGGGVNEKIDSYDKKYSYISHFKEIFDILKHNNFNSTLSSYKDEFVRYYLLYSNNLQDNEILEIVRNLFANFEDYFEKDDFGYFIMDYIINQDNVEPSEEVKEYNFIKKCLFEEAAIRNNFIEIQELKKYAKLMDEDKYSINDNNLIKSSFKVLDDIKTVTHENKEKYSEELANLKRELTSKYYDVNAEFLRKYVEARIDIKNYGGKNHDVILLDCDDSLCSTSKPSWFTNPEGTGMVLNSTVGEINFSVKCVEDGILVLSLKGLDYRDKRGNRIPIYIDYTEINVDGVNLIRGSRVAWHDNPYTFEKEVKDGQVVNVRVKWSPLSLNSDLRLFNSYKELSNIVSEGRIDLKNHGTKNNNIKILNQNDLRCKVTQPEWFNDKEGKGISIESNEGNLKLLLQCVGDGKLLIEFRSMDYRDENNKRVPVLLRYNNILVDGKRIIPHERITWHDDPVIFECKVKDGQKIAIQAQWSPFNSKYYEVESLLQEKERLYRENDELKRFKETVLHSNSWKLTSPLRKIKRLGK